MKALHYLKNIYVQIIILGLLIFSIYAPTLIGIYKKISSNEDYTHALLIPFIVAYLVWEKRKDLSKVRISPYCPALLLIIFSFLFSIYGVLGSDISAARISWWLWLFSITLFCYGKNVFKTLFIPLLILAFVIPLPQHIHAPLTMSLKLISSQLAFFIINLVGIPVHVEGNIIDLGTSQLQVVDACSGLRYVLPLIALGILCAYYFQKYWLKRVILVLLTLPIAILMNGLRVGITAILHQWVSPKVAEGFFHGFSGWLIFVLSFALLMGFNYILKFLPPKDIKIEKEEDLKTERKDNLWAFGVTVVLLSILFFASFRTAALPRVELAHSIKAFPLHIKDWRGISEPIDPKILKRSGAEEAFQATYINRKHEVVSLYIGYRGTPFMEAEEFFHSPTVCLPASGWKILKKSSHRIPNASPRYKNFVVTKLLVTKMGQRQLVYFWFQTKSKIARNIFENRFHLAMHALKRDNTYDITVHVYTPVKKDESISTVQERLDNFVRNLESVLCDFLSKTKNSS